MNRKVVPRAPKAGATPTNRIWAAEDSGDSFSKTQYITKSKFPREKYLGIQTLELVSDLDPLHPSLTLAEERRVLLAIYFETGGSKEGLAIADAWSRLGNNYVGLDGTLLTWNLFDYMRDNPVGEMELVARFEKNRDG
jgi:hypothetical protein